ncbi:MAG: SufD family Fe-S cluster assembly protein, partial [Mesorhizobium sp.]
MNIQTPIQNTPAELALIDAFGERLALLPGDGEVMLKRDAAIEAIKAGLPTRRIESWHYTDLRRLLTKVPAFDAGLEAKPVAPLIEGSPVLTVLNGVAGKPVAVEGVTATPVAEKLGDGTYAAALGAQGADDAIGALNSAFVADGWLLEIADGTVLEKPVEVQNVQAGGQVHTRFAAKIGNGVTATIVERQTGSGDALVSSVDNVVIGDGSEVTWLIVQEQPDTVTHFGQFNAWIGKDAKFTLFVMNAGGKLVRQEIRVVTKGEGSDFQLRGVDLLHGDTHTDVTMVLDHAVPHTGSREIIRNVVTGKARGVFQGRIN